MGILYLSVELVVDLLTCLVGGVLMFKAKDNRPRFYWGCIALLIGIVFVWENVGWLLIVTEEPEYRFTDMLNIEKMLKWYPLASIVALFPLASLYPSYLSPFKTLSFLQPMILLTTIGVCYIVFNGYMTPLSSMEDVLTNMDHADVVLRCFLFVCSLVTPLFCFLYPLCRQSSRRKPNRMMFVFVGFMFLFICIYVLFTLDISYFVFNLFGAASVVFALFFPFSIYFVRIHFLFAFGRTMQKKQLRISRVLLCRNRCLYEFQIIFSLIRVSYVRIIRSSTCQPQYKNRNPKYRLLSNRPVSVVFGNI